MLTLFGYKKCQTCRKAEKFLENKGIPFQFTDITLEPPKAKTLSWAMKKVDHIKKLFNTSGVQYRELKIKDIMPHMDKKKALELLKSNGKLIKRPFLTDGTQTLLIGFKEEEWNKTLN